MGTAPSTIGPLPQRAWSLLRNAVLQADRAALALALLHFVGCVLLGVFTIQHFPNSGDEFNYVWVSQRLLEGRLSIPPHPMPDMVRPFWQFILHGRWLSAYLPSWPLLMAPFSSLGAPWLANHVVGAITVYGVFVLVRAAYQDRVAALLAALALAANPMALLNGAAFFPHPAVLMLSVLAVWAGSTQGARRGAVGWLLLSGVLAGFTAAIRPQDAVSAYTGPGLLLLVGVLAKRVAPRALPLWLAGALLGLVPLLLHNWWGTGELLRFVQQVADPGATRMEFTAAAMKSRIPLWGEYRALLASWAFPPELALALLVLLLALPGSCEHKAFDLAWMATFLPVGFFILLFPLSPPHINSYGPRYTYALLLPLVILFGRGFSVVGRHWSARLGWTRFVPVAAGVLLCVWQLRTLSQQEPIYRDRIAERTTAYRCASSAGLSNAVVFLTNATGGMLPRDLMRNDPELRNTVVWSWYRSPAEALASLPVLFPGRQAWLWEYRGAPSRGVLRQLGPDARPTGVERVCDQGVVPPP